MPPLSNTTVICDRPTDLRSRFGHRSTSYLNNLHPPPPPTRRRSPRVTTKYKIYTNLLVRTVADSRSRQKNSPPTLLLLNKNNPRVLLSTNSKVRRRNKQTSDLLPTPNNPYTVSPCLIVLNRTVYFQALSDMPGHGN